MGISFSGRFGHLYSFNIHIKNNIQSVDLPPDYIMQFDISKNIISSNDLVSSWGSTVGGVSLTGQASKPLIDSDGSIKFDHTHYATFNTSPYIQTIVAVMKYNQIPSESAYNFFIFGAETTFLFCGGTTTIGNASYSSPYLNNAPVYLDNNYVGLAVNTPLFYNYHILVLSLTSPMNQYSNIGKDRTYHEFNGNIKDLIIYNRVLTDAERTDAYNHLKQKWGI